MRRILHFLAVALVGAAVLPAVAEAGLSPGSAGSADGRLATLSRGMPAQIAATAPDGVLDLVVTLDRPASGGTTDRLEAIGSHVWAAKHIPVAALRLPVARLDTLRRVAGVAGVYPNRELDWYKPVQDEAPGPKLPPLPGQTPPGGFGAVLPVPNIGVTGKGITVGIVDSGVDFTHPDLADAMVANVKVSPLGPDGPVPPIEGLPNTDNTSGHGTHVAGDVAGRGTASYGAYMGSSPGASLVCIGTGEGLTVHTRGLLQSYDWVL